jgi:hypothetical protein
MLADGLAYPPAKASSVGPNVQQLIYKIQLSLSLSPLALALVLVEAVLVRNILTLSPCTLITGSYTKHNHNSVIDITAVTANGASTVYVQEQLIL